MDAKQFILSVLVNNEAGVLTRVSGLFARRSFNIDSLSVADRLLVAENGALLHEYDREGFCALSKEEGYDPHRTR